MRRDETPLVVEFSEKLYGSFKKKKKEILDDYSKHGDAEETLELRNQDTSMVELWTSSYVP